MQQEGANWRKQYEQENANWRAQYRGQNGGSGGRAAGGKGGSTGSKVVNNGMKRTEALSIIKQADYWDEDHPGEEWANPLSDARDEAIKTLNDYGNVDPDDAASVYSYGQSILEENARQGYPYTKEQLKQIIASIGGYGEQVAEDLLSGQGEAYAR